MEGYDFDFDDRQAPEDVPGLGISGRSDAYVLDSVATDEEGRLARLPPGSDPAGRSACDGIPESGWTKFVPGVPVGQSICVRTSDKNLAILTITKRWTGPGEEERKVGFTYRYWYND